MADALHTGAAALQDLIRRLADQGAADLEAAWAATSEQQAGDARDYRAMVDLVRLDLEANLDHQSPGHRDGYLRALTDLLCTVGDGGIPGPDWDPVAATAAAFARPAPQRSLDPGPIPGNTASAFQRCPNGTSSSLRG